MKFLALQPLTSDDLPAAVGLDRRCLGGLWTESGYQREIDSPNSDLLALHWCSDLDGSTSNFADLSAASNLNQRSSHLLGLACAWAIVDEAHITLLAVDPAYQRQGLGQLLLWSLLGLAQQRGLEWATLEVRVSNQTAISLYQKFGFESVGQRRRYYPDNGEDALILWRKGLQRPEFSADLNQWGPQIADRLHRSDWHLVQHPNLATLADLSTFPDIDLYSSSLKSSAIPLT